VKHEMYVYTGNNWSHRSDNKGFKYKSGNHTRKIFSRRTIRDGYSSNITLSTESTAV
jgi:hypothetical protein